MLARLIYEFFVTPYLWLASVHATTKTPLARVPEVNSNVSSIDLLRHLDGVPAMGSVEVRYGRLGFLGDVIHLPVSTDITTRDILVSGRQCQDEGEYGHRDGSVPRVRGPCAVCGCRRGVSCLGVLDGCKPERWAASPRHR